ncbi:MAG: DbpA RNA binding domain-containing protein, partial [Thiomicrorhabdus sp.]|nr:DbpA RNA binding domain-containing protein [Thiomicrorhabdus sp.]
AYVHRIGRTGRAGRKGDAILFVAPRERRLLNSIEKATRNKIEMMELPSTELINDQRIAKFKQRISDTLATEELGFYYQMVEQFQQEHNIPAMEIAAALASLLQGDEPFLLTNKPTRKRDLHQNDDREASNSRKKRDAGKGRDRDRSRKSNRDEQPAEGMERFRIEVGHTHEVKPGNIVGAIANEAGLDSENIGRIQIFDEFSLVDLPDGMPQDVFNDLRHVWVSGQKLRISRLSEKKKTDKRSKRKPEKAKDKSRKKKLKKRKKDKGKPKGKVTKP